MGGWGGCVVNTCRLVVSPNFMTVIVLAAMLRVVKLQIAECFTVQTVKIFSQNSSLLFFFFDFVN